MGVQAGETSSSVLAFAPKKERPDATEGHATRRFWSTPRATTSEARKGRTLVVTMCQTVQGNCV